MKIKFIWVFISPLSTICPVPGFQVADLSMGDLLLHTTVIWPNPPASLGKWKKEPELAAFGMYQRRIGGSGGARRRRLAYFPKWEYFFSNTQLIKIVIYSYLNWFSCCGHQHVTNTKLNLPVEYGQCDHPAVWERGNGCAQVHPRCKHTGRKRFFFSCCFSEYLFPIMG